jgi:hypothetical protein
MTSYFSRDPDARAKWARLIAVGSLVLLSVGTPISRAEENTANSTQQSFATPELAVEALVSSVGSGPDSILGVLGPDAQRIVSSGDPVADQAARERFASALAEGHKLELEGDDRAILIIGDDEYPFPIPLVKQGQDWRFDTEAGEDEILNRRIGSNELHAIESMKAYVEAQREYASEDRDGRGPQYARRLLSQEGQRDGLYWDASDEEDISPLGPLVADAQSEGYAGSDGGAPRPFHGYLFRILQAQGASASGGAAEYVVNDRMIGGFGLIAVPAEYGNSGVMTFLVNSDGEVFEKDLGPETGKLAAEMLAFDPDASWTKVALP